MSMDDLPSLMREIRSQYPNGVPMTALESYCRRYLHYYHRHIQHQPIRFYGAWGWSEARRREFRRAFDASRLSCAPSQVPMVKTQIGSIGRGNPLAD
jgi:hypothetical protein